MMQRASEKKILMTVHSWGRGEDGQLGLGDTRDVHEPMQVDSLKGKGIYQIACGSGHTVILTNNGEVHTWGRGDDGRLGHGDTGWKYIPRLVEVLRGKCVLYVTCGSYHTAAVTENGEVYTWGGGMYGKLGHGNESGHSSPCIVDKLQTKHVIQVACGSRHTVGLCADGAVYTWGDKESGVCGHGDTEGHQYYPKVVEEISSEKTIQIAACGFHTACLTDTGVVYTWGEGKFGRLGHGDEEDRLVPVAVSSLVDKEITEVSCGGFHSAAISKLGELFTWGGGEHGQLGHGDKLNKTTPCEVLELHGLILIQITCGWSHTVSLTDTGAVYTWGNGDHGKLGHGDTLRIAIPRQVKKLADKFVCRVASYNEHTAALTDPVIPLCSTSMKSCFIKDLQSMINNPNFSDVLFIVEEKPIYAHRSFLAARSDHFRAMFSNGMKDSNAAEYKISDIRHPVFLALLDYIYTDRVSTIANLAVELYAAADFYTLDRLRAICGANVDCSLSIDNCANMFLLSNQYNSGSLRESCLSYIVKHFDQVSKTDGFADLPRDLMVEVVRRR